MFGKRPVFSFYRAQAKRSDQIGDLAKNALSEVVKTLMEKVDLA